MSFPGLPRMIETSLDIEILRTPTEFDLLERDWNDLLDRSDATVFQTYEWQRTWWRFFGEKNSDSQLYLILVREGTRLIAIAPFFIERVVALGVLPFRRLSFLGREISDYLDIIVEHGAEERVVPVLVSHLAALMNEVDVIMLEDIPHPSPVHRLMHEGFATRGLCGEYFENAQSPRLPLHATWEHTLESLSKKHRKDISYELRNISRNFETQFELTMQYDHVQADMRDFVMMHQERWMLAGHPGVFSDTRQAEFHSAFAGLAFARGWLFLTFLRLNGKRIAVNYAFHFRTTLSTYLNGMSQLGDIAKYSPGKILHTYSIQEAIRRGCSVYDFMRGRERYKYDYDAVDVPNWTLIVFLRHRAYTKTALKAWLLAGSAARRMHKETTLFRHVAGKHGWLSKEIATHVSSRLRKNVTDSVQKIRQPERTLEEKQ